jgi:hypothetical protein
MDVAPNASCATNSAEMAAGIDIFFMIPGSLVGAIVSDRLPALFTL